MTNTFPPWVLDAVTLPVAFAQVREDPLIDLSVVNQLVGDARVIMVASGGCTAALLAGAAKIAQLHLVDPNPAQLALSRLKLRLLQTADPAIRLAVLGHAPMDTAERQVQLEAELSALGFAADTLGPISYVAQVGPDHAGRYERVFAALREVLGEHTDDLDAVLGRHNPAEQAALVAPSTALGRQLDEALDSVMALPNLIRLFGEEATNNSVEPFSRHFARRLRHVLASLPADSNPYLWQMLKGRYPDGNVTPWLAQPMPARMPPVTWENSPMAEALESAVASFDFVHLSNILDWLSPEKARRTLELAWEALQPGGWVLIRQLNSVLDIPSLGHMFDWHTAEASDLHARDRSFFYRALHLGKKR